MQDTLRGPQSVNHTWDWVFLVLSYLLFAVCCLFRVSSLLLRPIFSSHPPLLSPGPLHTSLDIVCVSVWSSQEDLRRLYEVYT